MLFLASITTVTAQDNQDTSIEESTENIQSTIPDTENTEVQTDPKQENKTKTDNSKIYVSTTGNDTNDGSIKNPKATINEAINTVKNGGTIHIADGTYNESEIKINKKITIIGQSTENTILNSEYKQALTIRANVKLESLTITNAQTQRNGGAINNNATLKLENIKITNSQAGYGGAIYNTGRLTINKTIFTGNNAKNGGAVYNKNRLLTCNSTFNENRANSGSVLYTTGYINLQECNFTKNQNTTIYITENNQQQYIKLSKFAQNTARSGGAITNKNQNLHINNVTFSNNNATLSGGAVYNLGKLTIKSSTFTQNNANNGGGLYSKTSKAYTITITNTTFTENKAKYGGAIFNYQNSQLNIKTSTFTQNQNNAIYLKNAEENKIYNSTFSKNNATYGGAIRNTYSKLSVKKTYFTYNNAKYGGAIFNYKANTTLTYDILADNGNDIHNTGEMNVNYNWWGSNNINTKRTYNTKVNKWIYITLTSPRIVLEQKNTTTKVSLNNIYNGKKTTTLNVENKLPAINIKLMVNEPGKNNVTINTTKTGYNLVNNFTKIGDVIITATLDNEKLVNNISVHQDSKLKRITGIYVQLYYPVTASIVKQWVKAGITDVYVQTQVSPRNTDLLKNTISLCKGTNIRVHAWVICFKNSNWDFDISTKQQNKVKNFIKSVVKIKGLSGVSLDYVRYSGLNLKIVNDKKVTNFVKSVNKIVKGHDKNLILSASVFAEKGGTVKYYGQNYAALSPYLDVMLPMTYRYSYSASRTWLKEATEYVVARAHYSQVVSVIQTYYENLHKIPKSKLETDAKYVIKGGSEGYVLFRQGLISSYPKSAYNM